MAYQSSTLQLVVDSTGAQTSVKALARKLTDLNSVTRAASGLLVAGTTAIAGASTAAIALTKSVAANAKEIRNLSNLANTNTSEFQRMAYAAKSVGVEQDKLSDILKDVNDRVGDFLSSGGGEMQDFFENVAPKVGVTAEQFRNLSGPQALQLYYDSLEKANLSQAEMTFYLEAMANDLTGVAPLLADNGRLMGEMGDEAERLGLVLSEIDLAKLEDFSQVSQQIAGRLDAIGNQIAVALAPYITDLGEQFLGAATDANSFGEMAEKALFVTAAVVGTVADAVELVNRTFQLAGNSVAGFALGVKLAMVSAAEFIMGNPVRAMNYLIEQMNRIPGVEIEMLGQPEFVQDLQDMKDLAYRAYAESTQDFERIANAPWPSENIEEWLGKVQDGMAETAAKVAATKEEMDEAGESSDNLANKNGTLATSSDALNRAMGTALTTFQSLRAEFDPLGTATDDYLTKQSQLKLLLDQGAISAEQYRQAMILLSQQLRAGLAEGDLSGGFMGQVDTGGIASQRGGMGGDQQQDPFQQWLESARTAFTDFEQLSANAAENFTSSFGQAFATAIQDSNSLGDAFRSMADGMVNSILTAVGEMIAQWAVYEAVQLATGKATQAAAVTAATSNALAAQQMAAINAYSSTAAIPITGPAMAPAAAATALAATAPYVAGVTSNSIAGMAHDGIDSVPSEGTWLLDRGERVVDSRTNEDLKTFLASANSMQQSVSESSGSGGGDSSVEVVNYITVESKDGQSTEDAQRQGAEIGKTIKAVVLKTINEQKRPGGALASVGK